MQKELAILLEQFVKKEIHFDDYVINNQDIIGKYQTFIKSNFSTKMKWNEMSSSPRSIKTTSVTAALTIQKRIIFASMSP